jgi:hypothetical protein
VVDFALVGALLTLVFIGLVQLAVVLHVRNTLISCATEGARYGALADRDPTAGVQRTRDLITADLNAGYAANVSAATEHVAGLDTVVVRVQAPLPVIGLLGFGRAVTVSGHAVREGP